MVEKLELFAYCRVSTRKQVKSGNLENQRRSISRFIENYSDKYEVIRWFEDEGISAFKDRPAYERMINNLIRENGADGIIIVVLIELVVA